MPKTYVYKLTSDRGGAPCAPPPRANAAPLLSLSICKPAIRRTAAPGDRILGLSSRALALREGYPLHAVIYAAVVSESVAPRDYYAPRSRFRSRPDCIYEFHRANGTLTHTGLTPLHANDAYRARDIGLYPYYRNARTVLSNDFRYFGPDAVVIPETLWALRNMSEVLGQGHRVFSEKDTEHAEFDALFRMLWLLPTSFTPRRVTSEAAGHTPRPHSSTDLGV